VALGPAAAASDLLLDVLTGYLPLYFTDVAGATLPRPACSWAS
jgi:hypothetical protein